MTVTTPARLTLALALATLLSGCAQPANTTTTASTDANGTACNLAGFLAVQHAHVNHAEVTLCGTVVRVRAPHRSRSGEHRNFFVDVGSGDVIAIDANLDMMGNFPIRTGETTTVRGEYYYDSDGREGIHWTHHTDRGSHPPGFVILNGTRYD